MSESCLIAAPSPNPLLANKILDWDVSLPPSTARVIALPNSSQHKGKTRALTAAELNAPVIFEAAAKGT